MCYSCVRQQPDRSPDNHRGDPMTAIATTPPVPAGTAGRSTRSTRPSASPSSTWASRPSAAASRTSTRPHRRRGRHPAPRAPSRPTRSSSRTRTSPAHLTSPDFFDTERYPEIRFTLHASCAVEGGELIVDGELTIKGHTRPSRRAARSPSRPSTLGDVDQDRHRARDDRSTAPSSAWTGTRRCPRAASRWPTTSSSIVELEFAQE